jgi:hypothetical protein
VPEPGNSPRTSPDQRPTRRPTRRLWPLGVVALLLLIETRRLVEESLDAVHALLTAQRHQLDALASALMDHETLDEAEAYSAAEIQGFSNGRPLAPWPEGRA